MVILECYPNFTHNADRTTFNGLYTIFTGCLPSASFLLVLQTEKLNKRTNIFLKRPTMNDRTKELGQGKLDQFKKNRKSTKSLTRSHCSLSFCHIGNSRRKIIALVHSKCISIPTYTCSGRYSLCVTRVYIKEPCVTNEYLRCVTLPFFSVKGSTLSAGGIIFINFFGV